MTKKMRDGRDKMGKLEKGMKERGREGKNKG